MKGNTIKSLCFLVLVVLGFSFFIPQHSIANAQTQLDINAPINMFREAGKNQVLLGEEFTINYKFQPQPIPAESIIPEAYLKDKEIVLVIDTSKSMKTKDMVNRKTRLKIAKEAVISFLDKFEGNENINVSLIEYNNYSSLKTDFENDFVNFSQNNKNHINKLRREINKLQPNGGTNIGEGLRKAYYTLNNSNNKNAKKYIILLTDGEPTAFSFSYFKYIGGFPWSNIGYLHANGYEAYVSNIIEKEFKVDDSDDVYYFTNWGTQDYNNYSLKYAKEIAKMINHSPNDIESFYIAFTSDSNSNKLREISEECDGYYKEAIDADALNEVYEQLSKQILSDLPIHSIYYEETFPEGLEIVETPKGMIKSGNTIIGDIGSITYNLNQNTNQFEAEPFEFSVKLKSVEVGEYSLSSSISYKDIDGSNIVSPFPDVNISVYENNPPEIEGCLVNNGDYEDKYNLEIYIDEPSYIEVLNSSGNILWSGTKDAEGTFSIEIDKNDIIGQFIKLKAADNYNNLVEETIPNIEIMSLDIENKLNENGNRNSTINIKTEENTIISEIKVNNEIIAKDRLTQNGNYTSALELVDGNNCIEIEVLNGYNNSAKFKFNVDVKPLFDVNIVNNNGELEYGLAIKKSYDKVVLEKRSPVNIVVGFETKIGAIFETQGGGNLEIKIIPSDDSNIYDIQMYKCIYNEDDGNYTIDELIGMYEEKRGDNNYEFVIGSEHNTYMLIYKFKSNVIDNSQILLKYFENEHILNIKVQDLPHVY